MKRIAWVILALAALSLAAATVLDWMKSPEDRIREVIDDGVAAFNEPDASVCVAEFAADFRDEIHGMGKRDLRRLLAGLFLREHRANAPPTRLALAEDGVEVLLEGDERATARFRLMFSRGKSELGSLDIVATFELEDDAWRIVSSRHELVGGRFPF